jgi:hypothetical protein
MVKLLLEKADFESEDDYNRTPLSRATADGWWSCCSRTALTLSLQSDSERECETIWDGSSGRHHVQAAVGPRVKVFSKEWCRVQTTTTWSDSATTNRRESRPTDFEDLQLFLNILYPWDTVEMIDSIQNLAAGFSIWGCIIWRGCKSWGASVKARGGEKPRLLRFGSSGIGNGPGRIWEPER